MPDYLVDWILLEVFACPLNEHMCIFLVPAPHQLHFNLLANACVLWEHKQKWCGFHVRKKALSVSNLSLEEVAQRGCQTWLAKAVPWLQLMVEPTPWTG